MILAEDHRPPCGIAPSKLQSLVRLGAAASAGDVLQFDLDRSSGITTDNLLGSQTGGTSVVRTPDDSPAAGLLVVALVDGAIGARVQGLVTGVVRALVFGQVNAGDGLVVANIVARGCLRVPQAEDERKAVRAVALESGGVVDDFALVQVLFDGDDSIGDVHFPAQSRFIETIIEQDNLANRRQFRAAGFDAPRPGKSGGGGGGGSGFSGAGQLGGPSQGTGEGGGSINEQ